MRLPRKIHLTTGSIELCTDIHLDKALSQTLFIISPIIFCKKRTQEFFHVFCRFNLLNLLSYRNLSIFWILIFKLYFIFKKIFTLFTGTFKRDRRRYKSVVNQKNCICINIPLACLNWGTSKFLRRAGM